MRTQVLCWDDKAFYVEQRFVRSRDNFVMAIALLKQTLLNVTPGEIAHEVCGHRVSSPPMPEDVQTWVKFNKLSSEKLKKET